MANKGKIDRILRVTEMPEIFKNIQQYDVAIISISSTNPIEIKLLRAKLLAERFVIAKFKKNISRILKNNFDENENSFLVINIFRHPDFLIFLIQLTNDFEGISLFIKKKGYSYYLDAEKKEILFLLEPDIFYEQLTKWNGGDFEFQHFHFLQNNSKRITEITASQTIEELEGIVKQIKYFSPDGRDEIPDGVYFQKGGFIHECEVNAGKFTITSVTDETEIFITVLPNNSNIHEEIIFGWLKKEFTTTQQQIVFEVGKFFYGKFGEEFNEDSLCFEINGIDWRWLIVLNKNFVSEFNIEKALIKDFETGKIFLMKK
jgi:hypothetical protein